MSVLLSHPRARALNEDEVTGLLCSKADLRRCASLLGEFSSSFQSEAEKRADFKEAPSAQW